MARRGRHGWVYSLNLEHGWGDSEMLRDEISRGRKRDQLYSLVLPREDEDHGRVTGDVRPEPGDAIAFYFSSRGRAPDGPGIYAIGRFRSCDVEDGVLRAFEVEIHEDDLARLMKRPILRKDHTELFVNIGIKRGPVASLYHAAPKHWASFARLAGPLKVNSGRSRPTYLTVPALEALNPEGRRKLYAHQVAERSKANRTMVLKAKTRPYRCEACGFAFGESYGAKFEDYIEVHHLVPVGKGSRKPKVNDFVLLCANCHAVAHWRSPLAPMTPRQIRSALQAQLKRESTEG